MFVQIHVQVKTLREFNKKYYLYFITISVQMFELWPETHSVTLTFDEQNQRFIL